MTEAEIGKTRQGCRGPRLASFPLFFTVWLELSESFFHSLMIKPRINTWIEIHCCDPFFTNSRPVLVKDFSVIGLKMSEMRCRKELWTLPLQRASSSAGFVIPLCSGVGTKQWLLLKSNAYRGSSPPAPPASVPLQPYVLQLVSSCNHPPCGIQLSCTKSYMSGRTIEKLENSHAI